MTQMITSAINQNSYHSDKDAKMTQLNSQQVREMMHDHHNNPYHFTSYRHQSQQQNDQLSGTISSLRPPSPISPLSFPTAAVRPHSTPSSYPYSTTTESTTSDNVPCSSNSIDYGSLYEAMTDCPTSHSHPHLVDAQDSFDTMLSYLRKNDELVQHMDAIEQLENISFLRVMYLGVTSAEEKRLFLKKLSDGLSETFFRHSPSSIPPSDATTTTTTSAKTNSIKYGQSNIPSAYGFRERKHHLLPLHLFLGDTMIEDDHAATFEDNGVAIVEADFTTDNTTGNNLHRHDHELILHYIYTQCQSNHPISSLQPILNPPPQWANQRFNGHVFPEGTPNGIDLCVYFYHDAQDFTDVTKEMELLWKINALQIPILPILSMSNQYQHPSSSTKQTTITPFDIYADYDDEGYDLDVQVDDEEEEDDDDTNQHLYLKQRPIDIRRTELAQLFSQWRIKMMDISNLDIIGQPSFQQKGKSRQNSTQQDILIEQRLGNAWASSSLISPTPYHILTIFQFMAIDRWAVSKLLKTINDQAESRRMDDNMRTPSSVHQHFPLSPSSSSTTTTTTTTRSATNEDLITTNNEDSNDCAMNKPYNKDKTSATTTESFSQHDGQKEQGIIMINLWLFYALPLILLLVYGLWLILTTTIYGLVTQQHLSQWHASLVMVSHQSGRSMTLMVNVYDGQDQPKWAPEPPLLVTNLPLQITQSPTFIWNTARSTTNDSPTSSSSSIRFSSILESPSTPLTPIAVTPLPNKTQSLEGQYFYSLKLPPCSSLDTINTYRIMVKPSTYLPAGSKTSSSVQGSPLYIPNYVLCDQLDHSDSLDYDMEQNDSVENRHIMEAWHHFRQHSRFYLMNSIKIVEMIFTEGKEK